MASITLDFTGSKGLVERHQGDLSSEAAPNLRYIGEQGQISDGIYMPFKKYGYMSPAVASFTDFTGSILGAVNSIIYDSFSDTVFASEEGENILQLNGLDDLSVSNYISIASGHTLKDLVLYEANGNRALVYLIDTNEQLIEVPGATSSNAGGIYIGFSSLDTTEGLTVFEKDVKAAYPSSQQNYGSIVDISSQISYKAGRKLAQEFDGEHVYGRVVSGMSLSIRRGDGTGVGITIKASIQGPATDNAGLYTSRGAWLTATAYAMNDTVTIEGSTYQCIQAHTSSTTNYSPVGSGADSYWNYFGSPSGTDLASATFLLSDVPALVTSAEVRFPIVFDTPVTGLGIGNYWIVLEEVGSNMTTADELTWRRTINRTGIYDGYEAKTFNDDTIDYWRSVEVSSPKNGRGLETFDFRLINNRDDNWTANTGLTTNSSIIGYFGIETGKNMFLYPSDNGLLYAFEEDRVHAIDGSVIGGPIGTAYKSILRFPSYIRVSDVTETRSRMYISIQSVDRSVAKDSDKYFTSSSVGVYVWDRKSLVIGGSDYISAPGAKDIKKMFTSATGNALAITVGTSGKTEIRGINGNEFAVIHSFEANGFPSSRKGVSTINDMAVWLGVNGILYAYGSIAPGEKEQLYKIGDMSVHASTGLLTGPILVGNENASVQQTAIIFGWSDSVTTTGVISKWYPYGQGTLDSVAQTAAVGNVYSKVDYLPPMTILRKLTIYCAPVTTSDATVIATVKIYINQSTTPTMTKSITKADASRGYIEFHLDKPNVNAIQTEIEFAAATITGSDEFEPSVGILTYDPTKTSTGDKG